MKNLHGKKQGAFNLSEATAKDLGLKVESFYTSLQRSAKPSKDGFAVMANEYNTRMNF